MQTVNPLIRLGRCPGWSESSLGAQSLCWFCHVAAHIFFIMYKEWQNVLTLIMLLLQEQSALGLHCLARPICPNFWSFAVYKNTCGFWYWIVILHVTFIDFNREKVKALRRNHREGIQNHNTTLTLIISTPEPKAHWWAYRLGRPPSSVFVVHHRRPSSTVFKHLLGNHWANQSW